MKNKRKKGRPICRTCGKPAMCNDYVCYKEKHGRLNCKPCKERFCEKHWKAYFNKKFK